MVVNASINSSHEHISYSNSTHDSHDSSNPIAMSTLSDSEIASINNCDTRQLDNLSTSTNYSKKQSSPYSFRRRSNPNSNSSSPLKTKSSLSTNIVNKFATSIAQTNGFDNSSPSGLDLSDIINYSPDNSEKELLKTEAVQNEENSGSQILKSKRRSCTPGNFNVKQMFAHKFALSPKPKRSKSRLKDKSITESATNGQSLSSYSISGHTENSLSELSVTTDIKCGLSIVNLHSPMSPQPTTPAAELHQILQTSPPPKFYRKSSRCQHNQEWCGPNPYLYPWEHNSQTLSSITRRALYFKSTLPSNESGPNSNPSPTKEKGSKRRLSVKRNKELVRKSYSSVSVPKILYEPQYFGYRVTRDGKKEFLVTWETDDCQ